MAASILGTQKATQHPSKEKKPFGKGEKTADTGYENQSICSDFAAEARREPQAKLEAEEVRNFVNREPQAKLKAEEIRALRKQRRLKDKQDILMELVNLPSDQILEEILPETPKYREGRFVHKVLQGVLGHRPSKPDQ